MGFGGGVHAPGLALLSPVPDRLAGLPAGSVSATDRASAAGVGRGQREDAAPVVGASGRREGAGAAEILPNCARKISGKCGNPPEELSEGSRMNPELVPEDARTSSGAFPTHARSGETANGLWPMAKGEGGAGGEEPKRVAKASLRSRGGDVRRRSRARRMTRASGGRSDERGVRAVRAVRADAGLGVGRGRGRHAPALRLLDGNARRAALGAGGVPGRAVVDLAQEGRQPARAGRGAGVRASRRRGAGPVPLRARGHGQDAAGLYGAERGVEGRRAVGRVRAGADAGWSSWRARTGGWRAAGRMGGPGASPLRRDVAHRRWSECDEGPEIGAHAGT